jgi:hypothetical protein
VKEILDIVLHQHSDLLRPNIQTFAAVLECLGRKEVKPRYTEQIAGVIEQMKHYVSVTCLQVSSLIKNQ